jgi:hypothetical protein
VRNKLDGGIYAVKRVLLSSKDAAMSERVLREVSQTRDVWCVVCGV